MFAFNIQDTKIKIELKLQNIKNINFYLLKGNNYLIITGSKNEK